MRDLAKAFTACEALRRCRRHRGEEAARPGAHAHEFGRILAVGGVDLETISAVSFRCLDGVGHGWGWESCRSAPRN